MIRRGAVALTAVLLLGACGGPPAAPASSLAGLPGPTRPCSAQVGAGEAPAGTLVIGYPNEPVAWLPALSGDAASADLASIWGLPLYDLDDHGQLRPRLLREAIVLGNGDGGWQVRLILCEGRWSDDEPVTAQDVVATIEALRSTPAAALVAPIIAATVDGPDVVVTFAAISGRWQHVLVDVGTILPAHVLAEEGIEAYRDGVPVSGGSFALQDQEPGLVRTFRAHTTSALGAPRTATLDVQVVPRFELALGLLAEDRLDVLLGHLALEPDARVEAIDGLVGQVGRGSTLLTWQWQPDAVVEDASARLAVQAAFDLSPLAEALLDEEGGVRRSFVAAARGPDVVPAIPLDEVPELVVAFARWSETEALVARSALDGVERNGGTMRTASDESEVLATTGLGDGQIVTRRLGPWPSLSWLAGSVAADMEVLERADHAPSADSPEVEAGLRALHELAVEAPLVEVAVAHAWREGVSGIRPSGWPGIGFWSVAEWAPAP